MPDTSWKPTKWHKASHPPVRAWKGLLQSKTSILLEGFPNNIHKLVFAVDFWKKKGEERKKKSRSKTKIHITQEFETREGCQHCPQSTIQNWCTLVFWRIQVNYLILRKAIQRLKKEPTNMIGEALTQIRSCLCNISGSFIESWDWCKNLGNKPLILRTIILDLWKKKKKKKTIKCQKLELLKSSQPNLSKKREELLSLIEIRVQSAWKQI